MDGAQKMILAQKRQVEIETHVEVETEADVIEIVIETGTEIEIEIVIVAEIDIEIAETVIVQEVEIGTEMMIGGIEKVDFQEVGDRVVGMVEKVGMINTVEMINQVVANVVVECRYGNLIPQLLIISVVLPKEEVH